ADSPGGDLPLGGEGVEHVEDPVIAVDGGRRAVQLHQVQGAHRQVPAGALDPAAQVLLGEGFGGGGVGAAGDLGGAERQGGRGISAGGVGVQAGAQSLQQALVVAVALPV